MRTSVHLSIAPCTHACTHGAQAVATLLEIRQCDWTPESRQPEESQDVRVRARACMHARCVRACIHVVSAHLHALTLQSLHEQEITRLSAAHHAKPCHATPQLNTPSMVQVPRDERLARVACAGTTRHALALWPGTMATAGRRCQSRHALWACWVKAMMASGLMDAVGQGMHTESTLASLVSQYIITAVATMRFMEGLGWATTGRTMLGCAGMS